jgi:hypothetical protein
MMGDVDTIFGYVTYIYDDNTVKVHVTDKELSNRQDYGVEEKVRIKAWDNLVSYKGVYDIRISLIYNLLHRKVRVDIAENDRMEGIYGDVTILSEGVTHLAG